MKAVCQFCEEFCGSEPIDIVVATIAGQFIERVRMCDDCKEKRTHVDPTDEVRVLDYMRVIEESDGRQM